MGLESLPFPNNYSIWQKFFAICYWISLFVMNVQRHYLVLMFLRLCEMLAWLFLIRWPSSQMTRSGPGRTRLPCIPTRYVQLIRLNFTEWKPTREQHRQQMGSQQIQCCIHTDRRQPSEESLAQFKRVLRWLNNVTDSIAFLFVLCCIYTGRKQRQCRFQMGSRNIQCAIHIE